jgi:hypothetical protein
MGIARSPVAHARISGTDVAADEVRYLGDAVAVGVDYEELPAVIDMVAALAPGRRSMRATPPGHATL